MMEPTDCSVLRRLFRDEERSRVLWGRVRDRLGGTPTDLGELAQVRWRQHLQVLTSLLRLAEAAGCDVLEMPEEEAKAS